jgi:hypothetical protein
MSGDRQSPAAPAEPWLNSGSAAIRHVAAMIAVRLGVGYRRIHFIRHNIYQVFAKTLPE